MKSEADAFSKATAQFFTFITPKVTNIYIYTFTSAETLFKLYLQFSLRCYLRLKMKNPFSFFFFILLKNLWTTKNDKKLKTFENVYK